jgi:hypothetical protein
MDIVVRKVHGYRRDPDGGCTLFAEVELGGTVAEDCCLRFVDQRTEVGVWPTTPLVAPSGPPAPGAGEPGLHLIRGGRS